MALTVLGSTTLGSATSSISFSNLSGYSHLYVLASLRSTAVAVSATTSMTLNSTSESTTVYVNSTGAAASVTGGGTTTTTLINIPAASATANAFGLIELYIPNSNGSLNKEVVITSYAPNKGANTDSGQLNIARYAVLAAVSSMAFTCNSGNFDVGSSIHVFGIS